MPEILIYSTPVCPYCDRAKALFQKKGVKYKEIDVSNHTAREEMLHKAGGKRTVPQIFIGGKHIGGCDDLYALESRGELDKLLTK